MTLQLDITIHTIDEVPETTHCSNPLVGVFSENSLAPKPILIRDYRRYVNEWNERSVFADSLIGWVYMGDLIPTNTRLELTHIAANNNYYEDLKL